MNYHQPIPNRWVNARNGETAIRPGFHGIGPETTRHGIFRFHNNIVRGPAESRHLTGGIGNRFSVRVVNDASHRPSGSLSTSGAWRRPPAAMWVGAAVDAVPSEDLAKTYSE